MNGAMNEYTLLFPVLGMVLLTAIVARVMYARRIAEMKARRIPPQAVAAARDMAGKLESAIGDGKPGPGSRALLSLLEHDMRASDRLIDVPY